MPFPTLTPRRYRSVTTSSIPPDIANDILGDLLSALETPSTLTPPDTYSLLAPLCATLRKLSEYLGSEKTPNKFQDDFRHQHGFHALLTVLKRLGGFYDPRVRTDEDIVSLFDILGEWFKVLSLTMQDHIGNRRYFKRKVEGGGWEVLEQSLGGLGLGGRYDSSISDAETQNDPSTKESMVLIRKRDLRSRYRLFGKLFSFAFNDTEFDALFLRGLGGISPEQTIKSEPEVPVEGEFTAKFEPEAEIVEQDDLDEDGGVLIKKEDNFDIEGLTAEVRKIITPTSQFVNTEILRTVVDFWKLIPSPTAKVGPSSSSISSTSSSQTNLQLPVNLCSWLVLRILTSAVSVSMYNLSALHSTHALSDFLITCFNPAGSRLSTLERHMLMNLCKMLMYLGIPSPADTQFLLISDAPDALAFCLEMAFQYVGPAFFQFDLALNGYSAVELPALGRPFPPMNGPGYTFTAWMRIDKFDSNTHTTIFGVFDPSQTCFLMLYLEKDTRNLILQTSVTSSRPSVRFKMVAFEEKTWYHIALVHRRPRMMSLGSKASLYINGEFVEQVKCGYPQPPPPAPGPSDSFASLGVSTLSGKPIPKVTPIQVKAFLGTPRNLSSKNGPGLTFSKWSLASAHLLDDVLSDDFLAVHYGLGARYQGNFQDSLGGFQTYEASATLGLRNEMLHPGKDENSDILRAIRGKAAALLPENKTLLSFLPGAVFKDDIAFRESPLFNALPRHAAISIANTFRRSGVSAVAVNAAVPFLPDAFVRPHGVAILSGNPVVAAPSYLDDNMWRLAGFTPLALKLLHGTPTADAMLRVVEMIFTCVRHSWRNSDAMERDNGYAIMGQLVRAKLGFGTPNPGNGDQTPAVRVAMTRDERDQVTLRLLKLVLQFVGYNHGQPIESFIINPLAYRILLIDIDTWRRSSVETQELYYRQFVTFAVQSKYHEFNSRRLVRMRIVKRLLEALKSESLLEDVVSAFREAFQALVKSNFSSEIQRALALFITYMFRTNANVRGHCSRSISGRSISGLSSGSISSRRPTIEVSSPAGVSVSQQQSAQLLPRRQIGAHVLGWFSNLLCEKTSTAPIHKFARTVTNKWLLYLLTEDDPEIVVYGAKILARVLVTHGASYASKFASKTGGFVIMASRLRRWWDIPTLWPICFSILFGFDVANIDFERTFDFFSLMDMFQKPKIACLEVLPVIMAMLQQGVKQVVSVQEHPDSPIKEGVVKESAPAGRRPRARSMELSQALGVRKDVDKIAMRVVVLQTITRFLADLHSTSQEFRDFALASNYCRYLLAALYPVVVSTDAVAPEVELNSADSALTFEGGDVIIRPMAGSSGSPVVRRASPHRERSETIPSSTYYSSSGGSQGPRLRKASSFVLLNTEATQEAPRFRQTSSDHQVPGKPSTARLTPAAPPLAPVSAPRPSESQQTSSVVLQGLLELVIAVFADQILGRKEFPGFNLSAKMPAGFQEHQAYFESYILQHTVQHLRTEMQLNLAVMTEPRILMNLARFNVHIVTDSIFAGWFIGGTDAMLEFTGTCLEYLQQPNVASLKSVRLCSQAVATMRSTFLKMLLLQLSEMDDDREANADAGERAEAEAEATALKTMERVMYWQAAILMSNTGDDDYMRLLWYQLYVKLVDDRREIRLAAATMMRILMVQKPGDATAFMRQDRGYTGSSISSPAAAAAMAKTTQVLADLEFLTEMDNDAFLAWVDQNREQLDILFFGSQSRLARAWEAFVSVENGRTAESARNRLARRRDTLRVWQAENDARDRIMTRHAASNRAWMKSIYHTEHTKHMRLAQDRADDTVFLGAKYDKMERELTRPGGLWGGDEEASGKWMLDRTEGRMRMRLRLVPDYSAKKAAEYQPKRRHTDTSQAISGTGSGSGSGSGSATPSLKVSSNTAAVSVGRTRARAHSDARSSKSIESISIVTTPSDPQDGATPECEQLAPEDDDFELIDDPHDQADDDSTFEDKNRKVMRRLQPDDSVQSVFNVSRIIGLEAVEGILIVGKDALYIMDGVFHCSSGEIVNAWQAPAEERDEYSQIIMDPKAGGSGPMPVAQRSSDMDQESRHWRWADVLSISKRRFLFRDVAVEVFFTDGRSYLMTAKSTARRDDLYGQLARKAPHSTGSASVENAHEAAADDAWRLEAVRVVDDAPQGFALSSRIGGLFAQPPLAAVTRRWQKGEISNFSYLMMVNTMAGRSFNDLTQYPVFPWVLADYTSEELDLTDPRSFRDLSKPMGAQTPARLATYRENYEALAEIGETPFHYGTHYSTAMIVASYLIRLPPFVHAFILLQGGQFDHADRLFHSIPAAWRSAAAEHKTDVRELTPEFFCLPEFLTNINGYAFGTRESNGVVVDDVELPPWAHGDPRIFIAKNREALESEYVSQRLHLWIDLIFGYKQQGAQAVEAANVFHWMSYEGASNLDDISDEREKRVAAGVIHNFGQTPKMIWGRGHPQRDAGASRKGRWGVERLVKGSSPIIEISDRVASLLRPPRADRPIPSAPFHHPIPPFDKYLAISYADASLRFFHAESHKPAGLCENLHAGAITVVLVPDSKTLVTAGEDCVVAVHDLLTGPGKNVEVQLRKALFGHRRRVEKLAGSRAWGVLVSVSEGQVLVWDMNRLEMVRRLTGLASRKVEAVVVSEDKGEIVVAVGGSVVIYSINGEVYVEQRVAEEVTALAVTEEGGEMVVFVGEASGKVNVWRRTVKKGKWMLDKVRGLDCGGGDVCCLTMGRKGTAWVGDDNGKVWEWTVR